MSTIDIKEVEEFFFEGMIQILIGNGKKVTLMPGFESFTFSNNNGFQVCNTSHVNKESKKSVGATTILIYNTPIWTMSYLGWYKDWAAEFVKKVLIETYEKRKFFAGRGPNKYYPNGELIYLNEIKREDFSDFSGFERIWGGRKIHPHETGGYHEYSGMILL